MSRPKTVAEARQHFEQILVYLPDRFEAGVRAADWKTPAASEQAEKNFGEAMSKVIAERRRQKKIQAMANEDWQTPAIEKGKPVIAERIRMALGDYEVNFGRVYEPVLRVLPTLPARTLDWRANITNRLVKVVETWKRAAGKI